jgi:hypothetical protein
MRLQDEVVLDPVLAPLLEKLDRVASRHTSYQLIEDLLTVLKNHQKQDASPKMSNVEEVI